MVVNSKHYTIRIDRDQHERLVALAADRSCTSSRIIREALDAYLNLDAVGEASARRMARIGEYSHLVLDLIMREQFPKLRDRLIAETDRCLDQYHGA